MTEIEAGEIFRAAFGQFGGEGLKDEYTPAELAQIESYPRLWEALWSDPVWSRLMRAQQEKQILLGELEQGARPFFPLRKPQP